MNEAMTSDNHPIRRRTVLKTVGGTAAASGVFAGVSTASDHCDETVSDGASIQQAVDDADPGETICVEAGTYEENIIIDGVENVTLRAADGEDPTIKGTIRIGDPSNPDGADGTTLRGFEIVDAVSGATRAIGVTESNGVTIADNTFDSDAEGFRNHISLDFAGAAPEDVIIENNVFRDVDASGTAIGSTDGVVGLDIIDNEFENNRNSIAIGPGAENVTIKTNEFEDGEFYLTNRSEFDLVGSVIDENQFDTGVGVTETSSDVEEGFGGLKQWITTTVQEGVATAAEGSTVVCSDGVYEEDVTVDTAGLNLEGPNSGVCGPDHDSDEATIEGQVVLSADGTTLDGFDVSPPPAETNAEGEAVRISNTPDDVTVKNTVVRDFEEDGLGEWLGVEGIVAFGGDDGDPIRNVTISCNEVKRIEGRNEKGGAAGIMLQGNVDGAVVEGNAVFDVGREATEWAHGVVVTDTGNHEEKPEDIEVVENDISSIRSDPESELDGVGVGIESDGSEYLITDNRIESNNLGVEVKAAADDTVVDFNNIEANTRRGVLNDDDSTLDATSNWWGHASGPGGPDGRRNPAGKEVGTGDEIEGDVEFDPWLRRPIDHPSR